MSEKMTPDERVLLGTASVALLLSIGLGIAIVVG